ncbi:Nitrate/nitrite response regulator protein [Bathymodiolus thermophilus thioautotrophic gill symbiont]|uniref:Nitrate/nitrite response regulator protein n=1 Tax=Bathymodiolus thermophilus thioautotrophic gill symbiont TaxID=2360 RepID=A0A1J5TWE3_9GAMM|nr:response regulator [Bathymodiolus thermophilus thioautotrophic gill symbiont]AYQ55906.1 Two component LuxR family transcriptional regulator [Bathymodiolus thermophilus thioautotrophic gill symbiont]OIR24508.1 two-component system response regulator NarL [Bathymodiolus thermophilus thioautotrophic gill symbiont]CAB5493899.1 Nitrate/nitrite response regulator protein [Bathymodiolus thermophilus thioautotrophic gill symbiont]CAB5498633.1 Nitrate/nitrite response regulator protein [Bathymodiolus
MKVYIIDDHALFRNGLVSLLESRKISAKAASSPEQGLSEIPDLLVDIILLDLRMPSMSGIEVLKALKKQGNKTPVVMLTTSTDENDLRDCLKYGAQGYLLKDMDPDELVYALDEIRTGSIIVAQDMTPILAKVLRNELTDGDPSFDLLTNREKEVACQIAGGHSNKVIARELGISDGTVKLHVKSILKKLSLSSRVEVAVMVTKKSYCK